MFNKLDDNLTINIIQYTDKLSIIYIFQSIKLDTVINNNVFWNYLFYIYYPYFEKEKSYLNFKRNYYFENIDLLTINDKYYQKCIDRNEWSRNLLNTEFINIHDRKDTYIHENVLEIMKCVYLVDKLRKLQKIMKELYQYETQQYYDLHNGYYYLIDELLSKSEELNKLVTHYQKYNIIC